MKLVLDSYRAKKTSDLSFRLAEKSSDIIHILIKLCEKNNIKYLDKIDHLLAENQQITKKIKEINSISDIEFMNKYFSPKNQHPNGTPRDSTEPFI